MILNVRAWVIWLLTAVIITLLNQNPLYTLILLLTAVLIAQQPIASANPIPPFSFRRLAIVILLFTAVFNMLFVHFGETVLFRLPANWLWIGGRVTVEAAVFGLSNGLRLITLLALFYSFNRYVPMGKLVRLMPRAFRDLGVVVLIGVTYVPQTMRQWQRIRDAQAIRGHQLRGLRDWQPLIIPLLVSSLEQAMSLAEAMVSRGYGATKNVRQPLAVQLGLLAGLLLALIGWFASFWLGWPGWLLMGLGVAILFYLLWTMSRQVMVTRYQPELWSKWDSLLVGLAVVPLLVMLFGGDTAVYTPYPKILLPPFEPIVGFSLLLFLAPIFISTWVKMDHD